MALSTEEREFVFELGYEMMLLEVETELIANVNRELVEGPIETNKDRFDCFRKKALKYGIELESDFPISGTTNEIHQFIKKQSHIISRDMDEYDAKTQKVVTDELKKYAIPQ
ncbi:hypothetical protein AC249_AIPGENE18444 [Exaiptasia diaphana]|nr:hypothetical protein AC249_AIPGENE18444 [Exaiptasia diaphana]